MSCIFCDILSGVRDSHMIYEDASHVAFLDKYPIDVGHSLVVPKIANAVLTATGADAFSLAQNNGRAAKQIIPHVHIHIIPRYNHKGTIWTKRSISTSDELSVLAEKIKTLLV